MKFMSQLREQVLLHRAWFTVAAIMLALNIFLVFELVHVSGRVTTVLVPYDIATSHQVLRINPKETKNASYLTMLATADLEDLTNWTPATVKSQVARFLNRMTPSYRSDEEHHLLGQAKKNSGKDVSQAFFITRTKVQGDKVHIDGTMERWKKGQPQSSTQIHWVIGYAWNGAIPMIDSIDEHALKRTLQ